MASRPKNVIFMVDALSLSSNFTDYEWRRLFWRMGSAGVDLVRMLSMWGAKRDGWSEAKIIMPWRRKTGGFDWNDPDPAWDAELGRICGFANEYHVGILVDAFAQQYGRTDYGWSPFRYNVNGFDTWQATGGAAMGYFKGWIDRIVAVVGKTGPNRIGWGNELVFGNEATGDTPDKDAWARAWVLPLANHMRAIGIEPPNPFSAGDNLKATGHSIYNRLTKQAAPLWEHRDTYWVLHGCAVAENFDRFTIESGTKHYGVSDDGIGLGSQSVPEEKQALTVSQTGRRSSHWTWRVKLAERVKDVLGQRFRHIEIMPMEFKWQRWHPDNLHQEESLDFFWRMDEQLYGVDVKRTLPEPKPPQPPPPPPPPVSVEVCRDSGLLPVEWCSVREIREYIPGQEPRTYCGQHKMPCSEYLRRWNIWGWIECVLGKR